MGEQRDDLLSNLRRFDGLWEGELPCRFWGNELLLVRLVLDHRTNVPTAWQLETLATIVGHADDLRPRIESGLFTFYKEKIYGYAQYLEPGERGDYGRDDITPPIEEPSEIWTLISDPFVIVESNPRLAGTVEFTLDFDCHWDEEHGVAVCVRDWKLTEFGTS